MWWEMIVNPIDGSPPRVEKACGFQMMQVIMIDNIKTSELSARSSNEARNATVNFQQRIMEALGGPSPLQLEVSDG